MHLYVQQPNGGEKYVCRPEEKCKSNQRHFMMNTTTALYEHFLQQYPLRRGKYFSGKTYTSFKLVCNYCCARELCRHSDLLFVQKIEALLHLQTIAFEVSFCTSHIYLRCNTCVPPLCGETQT